MIAVGHIVSWGSIVRAVVAEVRNTYPVTTYRLVYPSHTAGVFAGIVVGGDMTIVEEPTFGEGQPVSFNGNEASFLERNGDMAKMRVHATNVETPGGHSIFVPEKIVQAPFWCLVRDTML